MKNKILIGLSVVSLLSAGLLAGCNKKGESATAKAVKEASQMTLEELKQASKKEFEENAGETFKVVGLTSVLDSIVRTFASQCDWVHFGQEGVEDNVYVKSNYKDNGLLEALAGAKGNYFADYTLVQDARSFSSYLADGTLHNFVPSDWEDLGLPSDAKLPLRGVHFNKLFWTNINFSRVTGKSLYNIWQLAGTTADADHLSSLSFQSPLTEQINMSFLASCYAPANQERIKTAYHHYYGQAWKASSKYDSAGAQWVDEFIKNISIYHESDGTCMKETQLIDDWNAGVVYYGAFAKMKDAVKKWGWPKNLSVDDPSAELLLPLRETSGENVGKVNLMKTVKWDWEIDGFNGFMYSMDSQVIENAKYPYTACLFARIMLDESAYTAAVYNSKTPGENGEPGNQYGYYYPGTVSNTFNYAKGDWTKETHCQKEIVEDYEFLSEVPEALIESIRAKVVKQ